MLSRRATTDSEHGNELSGFKGEVTRTEHSTLDGNQWYLFEQHGVNVEVDAGQNRDHAK